MERSYFSMFVYDIVIIVYNLSIFQLAKSEKFCQALQTDFIDRAKLYVSISTSRPHSLLCYRLHACAHRWLLWTSCRRWRSSRSRFRPSTSPARCPSRRRANSRSSRPTALITRSPGPK